MSYGPVYAQQATAYANNRAKGISPYLPKSFAVFNMKGIRCAHGHRLWDDIVVVRLDSHFATAMKMNDSFWQVTAGRRRFY